MSIRQTKTSSVFRCAIFLQMLLFGLIENFDYGIVQRSQTRGPRAACGTGEVLVRPATSFIKCCLKIILHSFELFFLISMSIAVKIKPFLRDLVYYAASLDFGILYAACRVGPCVPL